MEIKAFFDKDTFTLSYIVFDTASRDAVIIDPVLDFDPASGSVTSRSAQEMIRFVSSNGLKVHKLLETHAHADHISASQYLKRFYPTAKVGIGSLIGLVQQEFKQLYQMPQAFAVDGSQFDELLNDGQIMQAGSLRFEAMLTPGHTPACMSYRFGDNVFVGDALFMPDYGTGRCDFPGGNPRQLYQSIKNRLYSLESHTKLFTAHDYLPNGRELRYMATVAEQKAANIQLPDARPEEEFVEFRTKRDKTLSTPKLFHQSVQVNIAAGHLPEASSNGRHYLKIPLQLSLGS